MLTAGHAGSFYGACFPGFARCRILQPGVPSPLMSLSSMCSEGLRLLRLVQLAPHNTVGGCLCCPVLLTKGVTKDGTAHRNQAGGAAAVCLCLVVCFLQLISFTYTIARLEIGSSMFCTEVQEGMPLQKRQRNALQASRRPKCLLARLT